MNTLDFFATLQRMRAYQGDTLPVFYIRTDASDLTGCSMRLVIENADISHSVALTRICTAHTFGDGGLGYSVQLDSIDTAALGAGNFVLHFILTDASANDHRKLVGTLTLLDIPQEV